MVTKDRLSRLSPDVRRGIIIDAARRVFARDGYGGSSMSAVATELGGSKATLYKYFDTKEALFEAVLLQCCGDLFVNFNGDLASQRNVREYLIEAGTKLLSAMLEPSALDVSRWVLSEGIRHSQIARIYAENALDPSDEAVAHGLAHFHSLGEIECPEPIVTARQFIGMVRSDIHLRAISGLCSRPSDAEMRTHVVSVTSTFLGGIQRHDADDAA